MNISIGERTMKHFNKIALLMLFGVALFAQSVHAQTTSLTTAAPTRFSSRLVISPYAQAAPNDSYTFIGVTHPSLDSALTQIGLALEVIDMETTVNNAAGRVSIFTVGAGETHRIFVVNQGHATINNQNASFTDARTHLIQTVNTAQFGSIRITSQSERPEQIITASRKISLTTGGDVTHKFDNLAQLNIWGVVYTEASGSGFAMEFIGDAGDSTIGGGTLSARSNSCGNVLGRVGPSNCIPRAGRGIN
jgi:hypothetical protein